VGEFAEREYRYCKRVSVRNLRCSRENGGAYPGLYVVVGRRGQRAKAKSMVDVGPSIDS